MDKITCVLILSSLVCMTLCGCHENVTFSDVGEMQKSGSAVSNSPLRYAILAPQTEHNKMVVDLLTAELSNVGGFELVERHEIEKVIEELQFANIFESGNIQTQIELGRILGADRLFVIQPRKAGSQNKLSVKIYDTITASLLFDEMFLDYDKGSVDELIEKLTGMAVSCHERFRDGIRAIVGVPFFLSTGIGEREVRYQKLFSDHLAKYLLRQPGIAVVSLEELKAIQRELDFSEKKLSRTVPLMIVGEFQTKHNPDVADEHPLFDLEIVVFDNKNVRQKTRKTSLTRQNVAQFLGVEFPEAVSRLLDEGKSESIALAEQERIFVDLAEKFYNHGIHDKARTLREVVLFINPANVQQRINWMREPGPVDKVFERKERFEHVDYIIRNKLVTMQQGCMLVRVFIEPDSMAEYSEKIHKKPMKNVATHDDCHLSMAYFAPLLFQLPLNDTNMTELDFGPYASIGEVETSVDQQYAMVLELAYKRIIRCKATIHRDAIYDDLMQVLVESPECFRFLGLLENPWRLGTVEMLTLKEYMSHNPEKWREFKQNLRQTRRNDLILAADVYDLFESYDEKNRPTESSVTLLDEIIKLAENMELSEAGQETLASFMTLRINIDKELTNRKVPVDENTATVTTQKTPRLTTVSKKEEPVKPDPDAKITLEMIPQWRENLEKDAPFFRTPEFSNSSDSQQKITYHFFFPEPHDENETIAWNKSTVYLCRMKGGEFAKRKIFTYELRPNDESRIRMGVWPSGIMRVRSDGQNIWIATPRGVHCVDGEGKTIALFNESVGLPAFRTAFHDFPKGIRVPGRRFNKFLLWHELDSTVRDCETVTSAGKVSKGVAVLSLYPIGNNECLAMGRSGANQRTWLAKLFFDENGLPKVKTLLIAPRDISDEEKLSPQAGMDPNNIDVLFNIPWVERFDDPQFPKRKQVLVGRDWSYYFPGNGDPIEYFQVVPLLIDLETDEVMLVTKRYPDLAELTTMQTVKIVNGHVIALDGQRGYSFDRGPDKKYVKKLLRMEYPKEFYYNTPRRYWLVVDGHIVYSPGTPWFKIDCSQQDEIPKTSRLSKWTVPDAATFERYAVTTPFGICCVCLCPQGDDCREQCLEQCGNLFRLNITPESSDHE